MAAIAKTSGDDIAVVEPGRVMSLKAAEAIARGAMVRMDTATGRWVNANATTAAEARAWGMALRAVAAGQAVTAMRGGVVAGFDLSALTYDDDVFLSDTDGVIADVQGTGAYKCGRVIPGTAVTTGTAYDKLLELVPLGI